MTSPRSSHLDQFTVDLTQLAHDGKLDPAIGRDPEIRHVIDILLRRRQNNPILTGPAGVGKTAIVEGFAQRVARGEVPPLLRGASVRALDVALLQAGAGVRGEFENRLKGVISEVSGAAKPVILFIDEAHTLIGAGGSSAGAGDAANILKPALARGELRTIAATTWVEYKRFFEKDPALARRFQAVRVDEPDEESAIRMLRAIAPKLERHHAVHIRDEAVRDAVILSHRYVADRYLPDKAISALDTACARVSLGQRVVAAPVEDARRAVDDLSAELRAVRRDEQLGGPDGPSRAQADDLARRLERARAALAEIEDRWREESGAVNEILRVRAQLEAMADSGDAERERLTAILARLEKGLEAIQADVAMVPTEVDPAAVAAVISSWTGIPVGRMMTDEIHTILTLRERLAERIVGQGEALDTIARRMRTYRAGLDDPGKPVGVFLLVGPSGVGKTETAVALSEILFGGERNLVRVNMSEFQEAHTVSLLKGAPPGYVGYGAGGTLTEAVRRRPYSVVLLDEVEKAHADVLDLFYQVFDKGIMEDADGLPVSFRNTVILLTSNLGTETILRLCRRPGAARMTAGELTTAIRPELAARFKPALLARMVVVPYRPLHEAEIRSIVWLKLSAVQQRVRERHGASLVVAPEVIELVARHCTDIESGARTVDQIVTHDMLPALSERLLESVARGERVTGVYVTVDPSGEFGFDLEAAGAPLVQSRDVLGVVPGPVGGTLVARRMPV